MMESKIKFFKIRFTEDFKKIKSRFNFFLGKKFQECLHWFKEDSQQCTLFIICN